MRDPSSNNGEDNNNVSIFLEEQITDCTFEEAASEIDIKLEPPDYASEDIHSGSAVKLEPPDYSCEPGLDSLHEHNIFIKSEPLVTLDVQTPLVFVGGACRLKDEAEDEECRVQNNIVIETESDFMDTSPQPPIPRSKISIQNNPSSNMETCHICNNHYKDSESLRRHVERMHLNPATFICPTCGKGYYSQHHLDTHLDSHSNVKFSCWSCGKSSVSKRSLLIHEVVVCKLKWEEEDARKLGVKFRKCTFPECEKILPNRKTLETHLRTHSKPVKRKPPVCSSLNLSVASRKKWKSINRKLKRYEKLSKNTCTPSTPTASYSDLNGVIDEPRLRSPDDDRQIVDHSYHIPPNLIHVNKQIFTRVRATPIPSKGQTVKQDTPSRPGGYISETTPTKELERLPSTGQIQPNPNPQNSPGAPSQCPTPPLPTSKLICRSIRIGTYKWVPRVSPSHTTIVTVAGNDISFPVPHSIQRRLEVNCCIPLKAITQVEAHSSKGLSIIFLHVPDASDFTNIRNLLGFSDDPNSPEFHYNPAIGRKSQTLITLLVSSIESPFYSSFGRFERIKVIFSRSAITHMLFNDANKKLMEWADDVKVLGIG